MATQNPYRYGSRSSGLGEPVILGGSHDCELLDITADLTLTDSPRALYVNLGGSTAQNLIVNFSDSTDDISFRIDSSGVLPISPAVINANANLTVVAMY